MALSKITAASLADDSVSTDHIANNASISTSGSVTTTGAFTSIGIDDNADGVAMTIDANEDVELNNGGLYVTNALNSLTVDKGGIDRSGNTTRIISGRSGGNYADFSINIAGTGNAVNRQVYIDYQGNMTLDNGNLTIGTNGKGIDFSANSNVSGMTSELFDDYEEGSATVNMVSTGATFAFGGSDGSETTLRYIKIGRLVHYFMNWDSSAGVSGTTSNMAQVTNLPFSSSYGDTFSVWFHRGGPGAVDIMPTAYSTSMSFMVSPTGGGMWGDMLASHLNHSDMRLRISGTTIVN